MNITDNEKKHRSEEYCKHIHGLKLRKDAKEESYRESMLSLDGLKGTRYDRVGGGSFVEHGDDVVAATIERIEKSGAVMTEAIADWAEECERFDAICAKLSPMSSYVLTMRYRNAFKWDEVAGRIHYAPEYVRTTLKDRALLEMYLELPLSWK